MKQPAMFPFLAALLAGLAIAACDCGTGPGDEDGGGGADGGLVEKDAGDEDAGAEPDGGEDGGVDGGVDGGDVDGGEEDGGADAGDAGEVIENPCVPLDSACGADDICCNGTCEQGSCQIMVGCKPLGQACGDNLDCCDSKLCIGGLCSNQQCRDVGATCASGTECCTGTCTNNQCATIPGSPNCKVVGQACGAGSECCSTNCQGGLCALQYTCRAGGDLCYKDIDCCTFLCSKNDGTAGYCRTPSGGCIQAGMPCTSGNNCCTRTCADQWFGVTGCASASGCRMTGEACSSAQGCCGGTVAGSGVKCVLDQKGDTYGSCNNGTGCNPVGNICGANVLLDGGSVNAPQSCCDGQKAVCKLDSSGIPRCFGGSTCSSTGYSSNDPNCCIPLGGLCQFKDQCCGGAPCIPDSSGVLRCTGSTCTSLGAACTPGVDECCSGECLTTASGNACQLPPSTDGGTDGGTCKADLQTCGGNAECCSGICSGGTCVSCKPNGESCASSGQCCSQVCEGGVCRVPIICQGTDEACTSSSDCCSGLSCVTPPGSTGGICQSATCASSGQACSPTFGCCPGTTCYKSGTLQLCDGTTACTCTPQIG
jgi:hypothetical protein